MESPQLKRNLRIALVIDDQFVNLTIFQLIEVPRAFFVDMEYAQLMRASNFAAGVFASAFRPALSVAARRTARHNIAGDLVAIFWCDIFVYRQIDVIAGTR